MTTAVGKQKGYGFMDMNSALSVEQMLRHVVTGNGTMLLKIK